MSKNFRRFACAGLIAAAAGAGIWAWINRRWFLVNDITTGESVDYPELRSRVYYAEPATALVAAQQAMRSLSHWRIVHIDDENDTIDAEVETTVGKFLDDVTLYVQPQGIGQIRVIIRSRSRQGRGDLGQNAQHIRDLQSAMDARLATYTAI
ncbi:hypothetical protein CCAX7_42290 [Capsulimonas corticalis]|uniref:Uncharacterized protein n=1 Tax=Capsulimonas corticalis TaxID=2219043 RepID=A0A402CXT3_9BACT|nr:DUF1499 domain-containing protein [Capsulimonas corticalis]BDI32178.1 hypothetical protein CCAX7_42290 [Capsulimonas corticalis]